MTKITIRVESETDTFYQSREASVVVVQIDGGLCATEDLGAALTELVKQYRERKAKELEEEEYNG